MNAKDLEARVQKFHKYYFKGAGAFMGSIYGDLELALNYPNLREKYICIVKNNLDEYIQRYPRVSAEEIKGDREFWPLVIIQELNEELVDFVNNFILSQSQLKPTA